MKIQTLTVCIAASIWAPYANAEPVAVNYYESSLGIEVQTGDRSISGVFERWTADITFDRDNPEAASFQVIAEVGSITLSDGIAQTMLATAAWLAAEKFPPATFQRETVTANAERTEEVTGALDLHGVTAPLELIVEMNDRSDTTTADVTGQLDRTDFAIGSSFGPEIAGNMVTLTATVMISQ